MKISRFSWVIALATLSVTALLTGCASREHHPLPPEPSLERGEQERVWEEPMAQVVDVPPGLDPEGNYYRPSHKQIVEIKKGKWKPKE